MVGSLSGLPCRCILPFQPAFLEPPIQAALTRHLRVVPERGLPCLVCFLLCQFALCPAHPAVWLGAQAVFVPAQQPPGAVLSQEFRLVAGLYAHIVPLCLPELLVGFQHRGGSPRPYCRSGGPFGQGGLGPLLDSLLFKAKAAACFTGGAVIRLLQTGPALPGQLGLGFFQPAAGGLHTTGRGFCLPLLPGVRHIRRMICTGAVLLKMQTSGVLLRCLRWMRPASGLAFVRRFLLRVVVRLKPQAAPKPVGGRISYRGGGRFPLWFRCGTGRRMVGFLICSLGFLECLRSSLLPLFDGATVLHLGAGVPHLRLCGFLGSCCSPYIGRWPSPSAFGGGTARRLFFCSVRSKGNVRCPLADQVFLPGGFVLLHQPVLGQFLDSFIPCPELLPSQMRHPLSSARPGPPGGWS